jgi:hypothetical protein
VGIKRFVLPACVDLVRLTSCASQMCLGETPFERSQEFIRSTARSVRQRSSIPRGVVVLGRALGGGGQGTGPSAAGGGIVLHAWSVCTRGPRG